MGYTSAFSSIRKVIDETQAHESGCLVDTNFLVALTYEPHAFHEDAVAAFEVLVEREVPLYVGLSSRSELLDFQRRVVITEALMDMLTEGARWRISSEVRKALRVQKNWIDIQRPARTICPS